MAKRRDRTSNDGTKLLNSANRVKQSAPELKGRIGGERIAHVDGRRRNRGRRGVRDRARWNRIWERRHNGTYKFPQGYRFSASQPSGGDTTNS